MTDTQYTSQAFAEAHHLRYTNNRQPGYTRRKQGKHFVYYDSKGEKINEEKEVNRMQSLALPPPYTNVWYSPYSNGHLQATGKDAQGRTQYRYHSKWRALRNQQNHSRMHEFGLLLPKIRARLTHDLALSSLTKTKILATIATIMDKTLIRVGNDVYAKTNQSYGLTTFRNKHATVKKDKIHLQFIGKSHKHFSLSLTDSTLAKIVKRTKELPGYDLFEYIDEENTIQKVNSSDLNTYLHEISSIDISAKDFRTWWATVYCYSNLQASVLTNTKERQKQLNTTIEYVASKLGNTPAVCRKHYINPVIIERFELRLLKPSKPLKAKKFMSAEELITLAFLQKIISN